MVRKFFAGAIIVLCSAVPAAAATVTLTWDPNPESDVAGYVVFYGTASGQYTTSTDIGNRTSFDIALPDSPTRYYFAVCAYNASGIRSALSTEVTTTYTPTAALVASLRSSVPSPQAAGTPVTFTATASGVAGPAQFKWWILDGGSTTWRIVQDWSTNGFRWIPTTANDYVVAVWARKPTSTADAPDNPQAVTSVNFSITQSAPLALTDLRSNVPSPQLVGTSITFSAAAAGGVGPYQYKWLTSHGSGWTVAQSWSASNTFVWTPTLASTTSSVGVWVRSATSNADAPDNAGSGTTRPFAISDVTNVTLTANRDAPQVIGSKIQFTATVQGSGVYQYKWWIFAGGAWIPVQEWSKGNTFYWVPITPLPNGQVLVRVRQVSNPSNTGGVSIPFPIIRPAQKHLWK